jgi:creatinine amidohydrolase
MIRYAEAFPDTLAAELARCPVLYVALGALEWHGDHLPLGLDGIVAEAFAQRLAERVGGVVLPPVWLPMTTLPHPMSLQVRTETAIAVWTDVVGMARKLEARVLCLVTGHYAQGHMVELQSLALAAMAADPRLAVLAATPLEVLERDELLDHAARYETSQLMALGPDLVRLDRLAEGAAQNAGVLGESPRLASAAEGLALLEAGLAGWETLIREALSTGEPQKLLDFAKRRISANDAYVERFYRGSWEDAIEGWWTARTES